MKKASQQIAKRYRYSLILLRQLVITDFKIRYQGSVLGYLWSLLRPLFLFVILYVVFVQFLRIGGSIPNYPIYLLTGIVLWNFFTEITTGNVASIVNKGDLIRKLNFPKYVIVLAGAFSALINLLLNFVVIMTFVFIKHIPLGVEAISVPIFVIEIFIFGLALAFLLSALYVRLRDVNYIWEVIMQALFYATPIIYPLSLVSEKWPAVAKVMLLNPVAQAVQDIRYVLITKDTQTAYSQGGWWLVIGSLVIIIIAITGSSYYFRKRSPYFAEEI